MLPTGRDGDKDAVRGTDADMGAAWAWDVAAGTVAGMAANTGKQLAAAHRPAGHKLVARNWAVRRPAVHSSAAARRP